VRPGDVFPDYGGRHETFLAEVADAPNALVYSSVRGKVVLTWSITLTPTTEDRQPHTRVHLRLRLGSVNGSGWQKAA
jgi:hypothetical protein